MEARFAVPNTDRLQQCQWQPDSFSTSCPNVSSQHPKYFKPSCNLFACCSNDCNFLRLRPILIARPTSFPH
ncbi:hypothetical protein O181_075787 [Austropuccinia psidii MF-1]|uniref:Uncharacterized protein n=1 Tax=Austropuccinia psidii MF-1 TaxID=1389203 RepID=A0A9Q3FFN0_9BASI|nr:hypothetical protein [Austropuccinia psidii MF-1]